MALTCVARVVRLPRALDTDPCCGVPVVGAGVVWSYEYVVEATVVFAESLTVTLLGTTVPLPNVVNVVVTLRMRGPTTAEP